MSLGRVTKAFEVIPSLAAPLVKTNLTQASDRHKSVTVAAVHRHVAHRHRACLLLFGLAWLPGVHACPALPASAAHVPPRMNTHTNQPTPSLSLKPQLHSSTPASR